MSLAHPRTPQSPSETYVHDLSSKPPASPRTTHSLPTPTHSINGSMSSLILTGFDELSNKRKRGIDDKGSQSPMTAFDAPRLDEYPNKRKCLEKNEDRQEKKEHVEGSRLNIDDLHLDVGEKYLLCKTSHLPRQPALTDDMFGLYDLNNLAKSVARTLPDGQKGIKLRKTYKNHIKDHGVSGAFDSRKRDFDAPESLFMMMVAPQDAWDQQYPRGKGIEQGLGLDDSILNKAFTMSRGTIPKAMWDSTVLGELAVTPAQPEPVKAAQNGARTMPPQAAGVVRNSKTELARPKRATKKRNYQDSSFEGYGEGYVDDDTHDVGYYTGDGDDRGASRKRPKKSTTSQDFQGAPARQHSYGPGMVGA